MNMKRSSFLWILLGVVILLSYAGQGFGAGIRETVLAIAPLPGKQGVFLVGTRRGLYRSSDQGREWKRVFSSGVWGGAVQAVAIAPGKPAAIYLAAGSKVYRSFEGPDRWQPVFQKAGSVNCVAVDPRNFRHLLVGTSQGIYASMDQGTTWFSLHRGMPVGPVARLLFHPTQEGRCYALAEGGLFRSADDGISWARVKVISRSDSDASPQEKAEEGSEESQPVLTGALAIEPPSGRIYVGTARGVLVGQQDGTGWSVVPMAGLGTPEVTDLLVDPQSTGRLYAATSRGIFSFSGQTNRWDRLQGELPAGPVRSVVFNPEDRSFWVGTDKGLYHLWAEAPQRLPGVSFAQIGQGPAILEVHQAAIRYAEVMPGKIRGWRAGALWRNWLPKFTINLDRSKDQTIASSTSGGKTTFSVGPEDESFKLGFGFTWDLANLIWNSDQVSIDARSRLMVQLRQDILEEVTRLYFERKRLCAEFQGNPTGDAVLLRERRLRIEETTAQLDALTGGWFSRELN